MIFDDRGRRGRGTETHLNFALFVQTDFEHAGVGVQCEGRGSVSTAFIFSVSTPVLHAASLAHYVSADGVEGVRTVRFGRQDVQFC